MLNLIIEPMCLHCKENSQKQFGLCENCLHELNKISNENRCKICSTLIKGAGTICGRCFKAKDKFDSAYYLFHYQNAGRTLIHNIKFKDKLHFLKILERSQTETIKEFLKGVNCITYIPSPYLTFAKRGYNVSFEIGKNLEHLYKIPLIKLFKANRLYKKRLSITKHKKDRVKIVKNFLKTVNTNQQFNKVLIVDDVFTTGTTLNQASKLLKSSGIAKECAVFTLTRVI